jgi:hypothetical protein
MVYRLPFKDWLRIDAADPAPVPLAEERSEANSGEVANRSR